MFDEADMLLCGSFQNQVIRLIDMLRFDEKMLSRINKSVCEKPVELESDSMLHSWSDYEKDQQTEIISDEEENFEGDPVVEGLTEETEVGSIKKKDWRRVRKNYERSKQYIFVAATLPVNGKKTAGGVLKRIFPDAHWVSGGYLHCHNPRCYIFLFCFVFYCLFFFWFPFTVNITFLFLLLVNNCFMFLSEHVSWSCF